MDSLQEKVQILYSHGRAAWLRINNWSNGWLQCYIWKSKAVSNQTKFLMITTYACSILPCMEAEEEGQSADLGFWDNTYRRVLQITWQQEVTNIVARNRVGATTNVGIWLQKGNWTRLSIFAGWGIGRSVSNPRTYLATFSRVLDTNRQRTIARGLIER